MWKFKITVVFICLLSLFVVACSKNQDQPRIDNESQESTRNDNKQSDANSLVRWSFDMQKQRWTPSSNPPKCKDPFTFDKSPVDISKVTSILYPGQSRGGDYKAHGGFGFDSQKDNKVNVVMPYDSYLVDGSRYIEQGEIQYMLNFVSDCGIAIRFDHLATLSDKLNKIVDKFPEAKPDDSRSTMVDPPILFKTGDEVASEIGFKSNLNVTMDFGVYDYRKSNAVSNESSFQQRNGNFPATNFFGVCWFDTLPGQDKVLVRQLPSRDQSMGTKSDFCTN